MQTIDGFGRIIEEVRVIEAAVPEARCRVEELMIGTMATTGYLPESLSSPAADVFATARETAHRTMFERAMPLLEEAARLAPNAALPLAYVAYIGYMLYRDVGPIVGRVDELLARTTGAERAAASAIAAQARADMDAALNHVQEFLGFHPNDPYGRHKHGVFLLDLERSSEAVPVLEALVTDEPDFTLALNHLGFAYLAQGDTERAVSSMRRFVEAEPDNYSARDSLADALEATGDATAAIAELEAATTMEPLFAFGWRHLGQLRAEAGDEAGAVAAYQSAILNASLYGPSFVEDVQQRISGMR
jgi:predicted Zn-dependent protease